MTNRKEKLSVLLPVVLGGLFPLVVKTEHWLVSKGMIGARGAIGIEFVYLMLFAFSILAALIAGLVLARGGLPRWMVLAAVSVIGGLWLFSIGIEWGAAIVYAT